MFRFFSPRPISSNVFPSRAAKFTSRLIHDGNVPSIYKPRKERFITPTMVLLGIIPVFTFTLGTWQIQRLKWKVNLIDELEEKLQLAPLILPRRINLSVIPEFVFRKVLIRGKWDHEHTMLLVPRVREGVHGAHVVTPLVRKNGTTILVDRGFVSNDYVDNMSFTKEEGEVEVLGMLRTAQVRNRFTPDNLPEERKWYWNDVDGMAAYAGGEDNNVQPVFVEKIFQGHAGDADYCVSRGIPVGRAATVDLRNAHLSYVLTWFGLSALTSFMFVRVLINKSRMRGRRLPRFS
ncbi:mitochondrial protein required for respiration [Lentinula detonsa]|uniref:SURF1-like protein n=1 Tax=Lentinula detonsa TaxID=2804962 RepID=A0AA38Q0H9_9AGAR|nr:mitochondrial protein required for respiration [Lentinula detonsa]